MLYFIGLGLGNVDDITVKGLKIIKSAKLVYLENYTSIITGGKQHLEEYYDREIILADRELVEQNSDEILKEADTCDIAFLVVGDPFGATTHSDLILRASEKNISYKVIHNASIMNAVGCCGLQLYKFGETVSIVFWTENWKPFSFYDKIKRNKNAGLHTLCLLDIKIKEQSIENMMKGKKIYEPPRFMTCSQAAEQLIEIIKCKRKDGEMDLAYTEDTLCVALARIGTDTQYIVSAKLFEFVNIDMGGPLHSLVITGEMHSLETDMLKLFSVNNKVT